MKPIFIFFRLLALHVLFLCVTHQSYGQHTGSYDTTIAFMGSNRSVSVYVPSNYRGATKYRLMVCLHGLGDVTSNYRNALINSLAWGSNFPNTIFVCPEAVSNTADFFQGDTAGSIVQASIDFAEKLYHVDSQNIILQGFSLGGRAALRYGLRHYAEFKGLLLNTPAIQGVKNALNKQSYYKFDYQNASKIPIYITHGGQDIAYQSPIDSAVAMMVLNDGKVKKYEFPSMGHSIPNFSGMSNCIAFFDSSAASQGAVASVERIYAPLRTCASSFTPNILIRNMGKDTLKAASIDYIYNGSKNTYYWKGSLPAFMHQVVTLPAINSATDIQSLVINITSNTVSESAAKLTDTSYIQYSATGSKLPVFEGFENNFPENGWLSTSAGDYFSGFGIFNSVGKYSQNSYADGNTIFVFDNTEMHDDIYSPALDLSTETKAYLHFDEAFNYDKYTANVLGRDSIFADTLQIFVSMDCGSHWKSIYKKGGSQLATFASPILNPLNMQADLIYPADSNWRHEVLDLSAYAGNANVSVKFSYISALGGILFLDNIKFQETAVGIEKEAAPTPSAITLYPNPAKDKIYIHSNNASQEKVNQISIMDAYGRIIYLSTSKISLAEDQNINIASFANGIYYLQIVTGDHIISNKFTISR